MKIGHYKAFLLSFLHSFKSCNISFTLTCITGKYFMKPWPDIRYISISFLCCNFLYMIFVFCLQEKQTNKQTLGWRLHRQSGLSLIYLYSSRGKERGIRWCYYACFLQLRKHLKNWKLRKCNSDVNETCLTGVASKRIIKKCHEINKFLTLTYLKNSLKNAMKFRFFYCYP